MRKILFGLFILAAALPLACGNNSNPSSPSGNSNGSGSATNTPVPPAATATASFTATNSATSTVTNTPGSPTATPTATLTPTKTATATITSTATRTATNSVTPTPTLTFTSTPGCVVGGTAYGYTTAGAQSENQSQLAYGVTFSPTSSGYVANASCYFNGSGFDYQMALYSYTSSTTGTLLSQSAVTAYVNGYNTATLEPLTAVTAGTTYWIVVQYFGPNLAYDTGTVSNSFGFFSANVGSFPTNMTLTYSNSIQFTLYADVCPCNCP